MKVAARIGAKYEPEDEMNFLVLDENDNQPRRKFAETNDEEIPF